MKRLTRWFAPALAAALLTGCAGQHDNNAQPAMQSVCVISGEPTDADSPTAEYMGETVSFCCGKCKRRWDDLEDDAKQAKLDAMK